MTLLISVNQKQICNVTFIYFVRNVVKSKVYKYGSSIFKTHYSILPIVLSSKRTTESCCQYETARVNEALMMKYLLNQPKIEWTFEISGEKYFKTFFFFVVTEGWLWLISG